MEGGASAISMSPSSRPPRPTSAASWLWHWPGDDDVDGGADDVDTALVCAQLEDAFEGKTKRNTRFATIAPSHAHVCGIIQPDALHEVADLKDLFPYRPEGADATTGSPDTAVAADSNQQASSSSSNASPGRSSVGSSGPKTHADSLLQRAQESEARLQAAREAAAAAEVAELQAVPVINERSRRIAEVRSRRRRAVVPGARALLSHQGCKTKLLSQGKGSQGGIAARAAQHAQAVATKTQQLRDSWLHKRWPSSGLHHASTLAQRGAPGLWA